MGLGTGSYGQGKMTNGNACIKCAVQERPGINGVLRVVQSEQAVLEVQTCCSCEGRQEGMVEVCVQCCVRRCEEEAPGLVLGPYQGTQVGGPGSILRHTDGVVLCPHSGWSWVYTGGWSWVHTGGWSWVHTKAHRWVVLGPHRWVVVGPYQGTLVVSYKW